MRRRRACPRSPPQRMARPATQLPSCQVRVPALMVLAELALAWTLWDDEPVRNVLVAAAQAENEVVRMEAMRALLNMQGTGDDDMSKEVWEHDACRAAILAAAAVGEEDRDVRWHALAVIAALAENEALKQDMLADARVRAVLVAAAADGASDDAGEDRADATLDEIATAECAQTLGRDQAVLALTRLKPEGFPGTMKVDSAEFKHELALL